MKRVFFDTSFIIALETADDQNHESALKYWQNIITTLPTLVTTSYILGEVVTFFNNRNRHAKAVEIGSRLISSPSIQLIHVDEALFNEAWEYFTKHEDKSYSLTDCISFIILKRLRIQTSLTFDKHFVQAGFKKLP
jgi:uncharacterized protein